MGLAAAIQEITDDAVREERRHNKSLVSPSTERRHGAAIQPGDPESTLAVVETLWPGEADASQFVRDFRNILATLPRQAA